VKVSRELVGHFEEEGEGFLWWIAIVMKLVSITMILRTNNSIENSAKRGSSMPKKFKINASAGKAKLTKFLNFEGVVLMDFQTQGDRVKSECYIETSPPPPPKKKTHTHTHTPHHKEGDRN